MGERVSFQANGHTTPGYLARPHEPGPPIVVIQEWWGLVPHIEHIAERFAAEGFLALAPAVLGIYAGKDSFVTPGSVNELDHQLTALGKRHEFHVYPEADHAFFNDERADVYDAGAAADAWSKTIEFFRRELRA
jgi:dienelactone hydrolase